MARQSAEVLFIEPGIEGLVARVIREARSSNRNAARKFAVLLGAFDPIIVDRVIAEMELDPSTGQVAKLLQYP